MVNSNQVAIIGNLDGGHLGHQALLSQLNRIALNEKLDKAVFTFEPLTHEYFLGKRCARLMRFRDKWKWLKEQGVQYVYPLRFTQRLAHLSAEAFIEEHLKPRGIVHVVVGDDFRFGANRQGDAALLRARGIAVTTIEKVGESERISSSVIRRLIEQGNFKQVNAYLGRPYQLSARVVYGHQRGRLLGFPTANLSLRYFPPPLRGVYAVRVKVGEAWHDGVANVGFRPTVIQKTAHLSCEVHILQFSANLYGQWLTIEPYYKIRDEKKFDSLESLKAQIQKDIDQTRVITT